MMSFEFKAQHCQQARHLIWPSPCSRSTLSTPPAPIFRRPRHILSDVDAGQPREALHRVTLALRSTAVSLTRFSGQTSHHLFVLLRKKSIRKTLTNTRVSQDHYSRQPCLYPPFASSAGRPAIRRRRPPSPFASCLWPSCRPSSAFVPFSSSSFPVPAASAADPAPANETDLPAAFFPPLPPPPLRPPATSSAVCSSTADDLVSAIWIVGLSLASSQITIGGGGFGKAISDDRRSSSNETLLTVTANPIPI